MSVLITYHCIISNSQQAHHRDKCVIRDITGCVSDTDDIGWLDMLNGWLFRKWQLLVPRLIGQCIDELHRDAVQTALKAAGIPTAVHYPIPSKIGRASCRERV